MVIQAGREALCRTGSPVRPVRGPEGPSGSYRRGVRRPRSELRRASDRGRDRVRGRVGGRCRVRAAESRQPTRPTPTNPSPVRTPVIQTDGPGIGRFDHRAAPDVHGHVVRHRRDRRRAGRRARCRPARCGWWRRTGPPRSAGEGDAGPGVGPHDQPGAVEAGRCVASPDVGHADLTLGGLHGPTHAGRRRGSGRAGTAVAELRRRSRRTAATDFRRWAATRLGGGRAFWAAASLALKAAGGRLLGRRGRAACCC